jgi:hypothetical protein
MSLKLGWLIVAGEEYRAVWGRFDHEQPGFTTTHLWTLLSLAALLIATLVVAYRSSRRNKLEFTSDSSRRLFRELCRAHRLTWANRRLLRHLAEARQVAQPAGLFVDASYFDTMNLPKRLQRSSREIERLRDQLFS